MLEVSIAITLHQGIVTRRGQMGFWGAGRILFLDLGADYTSVSSVCENSLRTCALFSVSIVLKFWVLTIPLTHHIQQQFAGRLKIDQ